MSVIVKVNIPKESRRVAKAEAARRGITLTDYLAELIAISQPANVTGVSPRPATPTEEKRA